MRTARSILLISVFVFVLFCAFSYTLAAEQSVSHDYSPLEWSYRGNAVPDTYWTPYLPLGAQQLLRLKIGFRFSLGTITVKSPVKLTFTYDPANAQAGKDLSVKIQAEMQGAPYNTFESAFGLHLPNEIQIGFIGITAVPDILPWWTLPWDLCELLGKVPGVPDAVKDKADLVCSAIQNAGVNMDTKDALPLPGIQSFHDERTLIEVNLSELVPASARQGLAIKIYNLISDNLGPYGMSELLVMIRLAKNLANEDAARDFLTGLCSSAVDKLVNFATISVAGDPYFSVEGVSLNMNVRMYIPGGKGSGTYPLEFTSSGQEKTVVFKDITPFISPGDKLTLVVDSMAYRFKLKQGLTPKIGISLATVSVPSNEKYVSLAAAKKDFPESEYKLEVPLSANTDIIQSQRTDCGCQSMAVAWASPAIPLKGTVKAFDGANLVKTVTESTYRIAHNVVVPGLTPNKAYRFEISCVNQQGQTFSGGQLNATTKATCDQYVTQLSDNPLVLSNPSAQAGQTYIDFSWNTTVNASTEVIMSPAPDLTSASFPVMKKQEGVIQGWGTRGGERVFETFHGIRATDLEPGTLYYYYLRSWDQALFKSVGYLGQIATLAPPPPVTTIVNALQGNTAMKNVPIEVWKQAGTGPVMTVTTGTDGRTPPIPLENNVPYVMKIRNQECFKDAETQPVTATGDPNQEGIDHTFITAAYKPPQGAYVFDRNGQPMSGVTATMQTPAGQTLTASTDSNGYYVFTPAYIPPSSATVTLSKSNYVTRQVTAKVEPCAATRKMTIENAVLDSVYATLTITVKDSTNAAIGNAAVTIKEGSNQLAGLTTNAQGKATVTYNFNDNNANTHELTVTATPAQSSGIKPNSKAVSIMGGSTQDIEIMCLKPAPLPQAPAFGVPQLGLRAESVTGTGALLKWNTYPQPALFGKYTIVKAQSLTGTTGTVVTTITDANTSQYQLTGLIQNKSYRYVMIVAGSNNQTIVGPVPVDFRTAATVPVISNFRLSAETVEAGGSITVSASLSDPDSQVKKVVVKLNPVGSKSERVAFSKEYAANSIAFSQAINFTAAETGKCQVTLEVSDETSTVSQDYAVSVVQPKAEKPVTQEAQEQEKPLTVQPKLQKPALQKPQAMQKPVTEKPAAAQQQPQTQPPAQQPPQQPAAVAEKTALKFISKPPSAYVNVEYALKVGVRSVKGKAVASGFAIDWGDGAKASSAVEAVVKHVYQKPGKYTISATATMATNEAFIAPGPESFEVQVKVKPPTVVLSRGAAKAGVPGHVFNVKIEPGSYPIQSWLLSYGDGKSESGKAAAARTVTHVFAGPGEYKVELSAADINATAVKKTLEIKIAVPAVPAPKAAGNN